MKFSLREVDIVSCIINGRSPKFIAHLLDISPKTVEAHIRNIKIKVNCSSKEQMVSFIEKSNKYQLISQHYRDLIVNVEFEKSLQNISSEVINKNLELQIICLIKNDNEEDIKCCKLIKHLFMAGIKANLEYKSLSDLDFKSNNYVLVCSAQVAQEIYDQYKEQIKNIIFFTNDSLDIKQKGQIINSASPNNYYSAVLELISKFYSSKQIESLIDKFKSFYKSRSSDFYTDDRITRIKYYWNEHKMPIILCLILILSTCIFLHFYTATQSKSINMYTQFIGKDILLPRKNLIHKIDEIFEKQHGIKYVILIGEGGIGKTVISRHYLQLKDFKIKAEINAETYNSLSDSFSNLAITLANTKELQERLSYIQAITDYKKRNKQIFLFVLSILKKIGNWCLLFDNVDNFNWIRDFIPSNDGTPNNGKVIITTRNENFKNIIIFPHFSGINVPLLTVNEQEELFSKITYGRSKRNESIDQSELKNFLKNIPSMPLDICAAAFYIRNTHISFDDYLKISKTPCQLIEKIQSNFLAEVINYNKTRYGIISSVFEKLTTSNADFKELLLFICLLNSQNIPRIYLEKCKDHTVVQDFIHNLRKYSLITEKNDTFSIHRSTQEIGLKYILSQLSEHEKIQFLDNIIKIMIPYQNIVWNWYKLYQYRMIPRDSKKIICHLRSLLNKLQFCHLSTKKMEEYETKIKLTLFYAYSTTFSVINAQKLVSKILELNKRSKCIRGYDLAFLLLESIHLYTDTEKIEMAKLYMDECITLCDSIKNAEIIKAVCLCYLARYYSKNFKIKLADKLIDKSLMLLKKSPFKSDSASVLIANQHYRCFGNYYINKPETYKSIDLLLKTLNEQGFSRFFHKSHDKNIKIPFEKAAVSANDIVELRMNLIRSYNCVGEFDKAFENVLEAEYLYQHMTDCEEDIIVQKAKLFLEKGRTLLRLGKVREAYEVLTGLFSVREVFSFRFCFFGLLHKSEACIRLKKFREAYRNCLSALRINLGSNSGGNFGKLSLCSCRYNMAFAKYKMADYKNALRHFKEFFQEAHEFCNNFLSKDALYSLEKQKSFDCTENESQITQCLRKSLKIFTAIYGENHSFVKDYVAPNCL